MFNSNNIPSELKKLKQWVCYRTQKNETKTIKFMISPITGKFAKSNEPNTWTDYETALRYMFSRRLEGLALVLTKDLVFIDIDHSIDDEGNFSDLTKDLLEGLPNTYAEKSCSGKGVHIFCKGNLPKDALKRNDNIGLEMYDTRRFVCVTGDVIDNRKELLDYSNIIENINYSYIGKRPPKVINPVRTNISFDNNELIDKIRRSKNGSKFEQLYKGDISGYASQSNADYAFVRMLTFWTQDRNQIDAIVRRSGLYRDKWDRAIGNSTYGEITIENALRETTQTYSGANYKSSGGS